MGKKGRANSKKASRKADISDVERHLEDLRDEERIFGKPLDSLSDNQLFVNDKRGDDKFSAFVSQSAHIFSEPGNLSKAAQWREKKSYWDRVLGPK